MKFLLKLLITFGIIFSASQISAEEKVVGDYTVYYNTFNSSFLTPKVAKSYGLQRHSTGAIINVAIKKADGSPLGKAVIANVQGRAKNQISQVEDLAFKEIKEGEAIYYIADFQFRPKEYSSLNLSIRLPDLERPIEIKLDKKFYKD